MIGGSVMEDNKIVRYTPNIKDGLTQEQVQNRIDQKLINYDTSVPTKSIKEIIAKNIFTLFNLLNVSSLVKAKEIVS